MHTSSWLKEDKTGKNQRQKKEGGTFSLHSSKEWEDLWEIIVKEIKAKKRVTPTGIDITGKEEQEMIWNEYAETLREVLKLEGNPIAITFSMAPAQGARKGKHWVCGALQEARDGAIVNLDKGNSACHGGTWHLGLGPRPTGKEDKVLKKFLVEGEKLFCSITTFHRAMTLTAQPPLGLADYVVFSPLGKAPFKPDLVLFLCNAEQACRLLTLATYDSGVSPKTELVGSACHMAITYPLVSGEINVSFMDYTARKMKGYEPDELFVSVPYHRMAGIMESIPFCTAGTAKAEYPPEFRHLAEGSLETKS